MKIVLMHAPLDDATIPYHSTAYLTGHLVQNGFTNVAMRDINVEFVNYCLEPETILEFNRQAEQRLRHLRERSTLSFEEQEEFYGLCLARQQRIDEVAGVAAGFRDRESFEDYPRYVRNVNRLVEYFSFLGNMAYPSEIVGFTLRNKGRYSAFNLADILNQELRARICRPFEHFFWDRLTADNQLNAADVLGISIIYDHQLLYALHFAHLIKRRWPDKRVVLGGTSISQFYKHLRDKTLLARLFCLCDAIVLGEGETAICEIADSDGNLEGRTDLTNTATFDPIRNRLHLPPIRYENVATLGRPVYDHPWHLYLSPERGINYSPTRGCYWNRCTFCDYGLNSDSPTSPWRERKIDQVISDLQYARENHGVKYVYFAVDVMAPGYLERLSDAIVSSKLDIRWSAELRMEKIFSAERCKKMAKSGCVCVSFGMESGNQRILDLIDKGTKVAYMGQTMKNFAESGIAVQLMAFTDFPTETPTEKLETMQFITQHDSYWATGGMGTFLLTGTAIIAKDPARFGLTTYPTQDCDVGRSVAYKIDAETGQRMTLAEESDASFNESGGIFPHVMGRPWAGGTDTLHSMIYYEKYGWRFFKDNPPDAPDEEETFTGDAVAENCSLVVNGAVVESGFDLNTIVENRKSFAHYLQKKLAVPAEPTYASFRTWYASRPPLEADGTKTYWVSTGAQLLKIDKLVYRLLVLGSSKNIGLAELLAPLPVPLRDRVRQYILDLEPKGFISFVRHGRRLRRPKADSRIVYHGTAAQRPFLKLRQAPSYLGEAHLTRSEPALELVQISM